MVVLFCSVLFFCWYSMVFVLPKRIDQSPWHSNAVRSSLIFFSFTNLFFSSRKICTQFAHSVEFVMRIKCRELFHCTCVSMLANRQCVFHFNRQLWQDLKKNAAQLYKRRYVLWLPIEATKNTHTHSLTHNVCNASNIHMLITKQKTWGERREEKNRYKMSMS